MRISHKRISEVAAAALMFFWYWLGLAGDDAGNQNILNTSGKLSTLSRIGDYCERMSKIGQTKAVDRNNW